MTHHESTRMREIAVMGIRTRVLEAGRAGDEAVVFVHGGPGSANDWDYFLPRVGEFARAVAFDLVGFGRADKPPYVGYSGPVWATFVQHVLNELGIRRVHLVATDLGGEAATHWAAAHPDAFASAALLNTGTLIRYRWHAIAQFSRLPVLGALSVLLGGVLMRPALWLYEPRLPRNVLDRWRREYDWASRRAIRRFYRSGPGRATSLVVDSMRPLDRPALVVWGARNRFVPRRHADDQRRSFPRAEIVVLPEEGHYAHLRAPQMVAERLLPFLREQVGTDGASSWTKAATSPMPRV
jgi:pimeloyl-ACP methyl ester carboxylesterase